MRTPHRDRPGTRRRRSRFIPRLLFALLALATAPGASRAADSKAAAPDGASMAGSWRTDRIEIRLAADAARQSHARYLAAAREGALPSLGIAGLDRASRALGGVRFEPEFRGESPPEPGSGATDFTAFYLVHLSPGADLERAVAAFRALPEVASADPIAVLPVSVVPNDSLFAISSWFHQPSRHDVHATEAWNLTIGDTSIVIAILDTGILPYHPDLGGRVAGGTGNLWSNGAEVTGTAGIDDDANGFVDDERGWDFVDQTAGQVAPGEDPGPPDNDPSDFAGHGTAVAGLAGALTDNASGVAGMAWRVRLMPVRIGWSANAAPLGLVDMSYVAQGIRYATRMGADVINCSFATRNQSGLYEAAAEATRRGVTIVVAAGNNGQPHELAEREDVVAVGATDAADRVATFSNRGEFVDLCAPGDGIVSTFVEVPRSVPVRPGYVPTANGLDGTSMSAPLVAGSIALLHARRRALGEPRHSPTDVLLRLRDTADDISSVEGGEGYGSGRLNAHRLLADPPASSARPVSQPTVGPGVMIRSMTSGALQAWAQGDGLSLYRGRGEFVTASAVVARRVTSGVAAATLGPGRGIGLFASLNDGNVMGDEVGRGQLPGWPVRITGPTTALTIPALGDLDGDDTLEVVAAGVDGRVWAWRVSGARVTGFPVALGSGVVGAVALSDLDGLPGVEIVAATEAGDVHVLRGSGEPLDGWPVAANIPITAPVIARLGVDSVAIVVGAANRVFAFAPDGSPVFAAPLPGGVASVIGPELALGDVDGDGADDLVAVAANPAQIAAFDSVGRALATPGWPVSLPSVATGPPVIGRLRGSGAGDSSAAVLVMTGAGLLAFDGRGRRLRSFPKPGGAGRHPSIVELDGTGIHQVLAGTGRDTQLYVYNGEVGSAGAAPWFTPRGNFARTGSRIYAPTLALLDDLAPSPVANLRADSIGVEGVLLSWNAPGDDGPFGRAFAYELRHARFPLTEANFATGDLVPDVPAPAPAGTVERHRVLGLERDASYWFAIRARDDMGNVAPLSNVIFLRTGSGTPVVVVSLAAVARPSRLPVLLRWEGLGGDTGSQSIAVYEVGGRRVRTIALGADTRGVVEWNGRDDRDRSVPAGVYFARLVSGSFHADTRIVLLP